ncbi:hypothetical protein J437_LFUL016352 [Ladona fulva]|uniref:Dynein heavy chain linker domain-containing protein n=1 Tax=Ladona fulva TaxID=123851 RepID=A0A8K0P792_LADFU|nr:hypothetical protein J437_LFUL016352 [Ladona fulva]
MEPHKIVGIYRLKAIDDIFNAIEENQVSLAAMKSTRFVEPFIEEVKYWEKTLSMMANNIFLGEDISKQLPDESGKFNLITKEWEKISVNIYEKKNALKCLTAEGLLDNISSLNLQLEVIQKALEDYLEVKRRNFPRFYFISNDDLLDILGNSKNPEAVQPHLKKCFDNLHRLKLKPDPLEALGMYSSDGEFVEMKQCLGWIQN